MNQSALVNVVRGIALLLAALLVGQLLRPLVAGSGEIPPAVAAFEPRVVRLGDTLVDLPVMPIPEDAWETPSPVPLSSLVARSPGPCTFLIVYSTTCGACRRAAAAWRKAAPALRDHLGPAVRWVSLPDREERIRAFHAEFNLSAPGYRIGSTAEAEAIGVIGTPTVYAVDSRLRVVRMPGAAPEELVRGVGPGALEASCREQGA